MESSKGDVDAARWGLQLHWVESTLLCLHYSAVCMDPFPSLLLLKGNICCLSSFIPFGRCWGIWVNASWDGRYNFDTSQLLDLQVAEGCRYLGRIWYVFGWSLIAKLMRSQNHCNLLLARPTTPALIQYRGQLWKWTDVLWQQNHWYRMTAVLLKK